MITESDIETCGAHRSLIPRHPIFGGQMLHHRSSPTRMYTRQSGDEQEKKSCREQYDEALGCTGARMHSRALMERSIRSSQELRVRNANIHYESNA